MCLEQGNLLSRRALFCFWFTYWLTCLNTGFWAGRRDRRWKLPSPVSHWPARRSNCYTNRGLVGGSDFWAGDQVACLSEAGPGMELESCPGLPAAAPGDRRVIGDGDRKLGLMAPFPFPVSGQVIYFVYSQPNSNRVCAPPSKKNPLQSKAGWLANPITVHSRFSWAGYGYDYSMTPPPPPGYGCCVDVFMGISLRGVSHTPRASKICICAFARKTTMHTSMDIPHHTHTHRRCITSAGSTYTA